VYLEHAAPQLKAEDQRVLELRTTTISRAPLWSGLSPSLSLPSSIPHFLVYLGVTAFPLLPTLLEERKSEVEEGGESEI
jgi:hypothetical protein